MDPGLAAAHQGGQAADLRSGIFVHPGLVGGRYPEIAAVRTDVVAAQMLTQQEGIQRRHFVDETQQMEIALHVFGIGVIADLVKQIFKTALSDEQGFPAGPQIGDLERNNHLGGKGAPGPEQVHLIGAQPVLQYDRVVEHPGTEQRRRPVVGIFRLRHRNRNQI